MKNQTKRDEYFKDNLYKRLNKIEGQVRGVKRMIEKDAYCNDVINQILSIKSALDSVNKLILESHINNCLVEKIKNDDKEVLDELMSTISKIIK
ncbi:metal-sensitive transcriptional regulator [[Clostridium] colinum]|uniref:metal-sensitive transcriptional regulator n=1 Tax=[Clostridium] colinum TaxID=36835 RepID=UPI0020248FC3|nr:metal-sensitive transcriptional regulator [[Clostridium] colinum]